MEIPDQNSHEALCAEILAEARRESEQIIRLAQDQAAELLRQAAAKMAKLKEDQLALARTEAVRRKELVLATVPVEVGQERSRANERLLQSIYERAQRQFQARRESNYRDTVVALASDAISHMTGERFKVKLLAGDLIALGDGLPQAITTRLGKLGLSIQISDDPTITEGGLLVQDAAGIQVWDNRLPARLNRMWPELRQQVAARLSLGVRTAFGKGNP